MKKLTTIIYTISTASFLATSIAFSSAQEATTSFAGTLIKIPAKDVTPSIPENTPAGALTPPPNDLVPVQKRDVRPYKSMIAELPPEKRLVIDSLPAGKTLIGITEELTKSSSRSLLLTQKIDAYLMQKKARGEDVSYQETTLETAKSSLTAANISISTASSLIEGVPSEVSTSTYKKALQGKKLEIRSSLESARKNIKEANKLLREIVSPQKPASSSSASTSPEVIVPPQIPRAPVANTATPKTETAPAATTTKTIKMLEM